MSDDVNLVVTWCLKTYIISTIVQSEKKLTRSKQEKMKVKMILYQVASNAFDNRQTGTGLL